MCPHLRLCSMPQTESPTEAGKEWPFPLHRWGHEAKVTRGVEQVTGEGRAETKIRPTCSFPDTTCSTMPVTSFPRAQGQLLWAEISGLWGVTQHHQPRAGPQGRWGQRPVPPRTTGYFWWDRDEGEKRLSAEALALLGSRLTGTSPGMKSSPGAGLKDAASSGTGSSVEGPSWAISWTLKPTPGTKSATHNCSLANPGTGLCRHWV